MTICIEERFRQAPGIEVSILDEPEFDQVVRGRSGLYYDRGVVPLDLDPVDKLLRAAFCPDIILAETEDWDEQLFVAYMVYWTLRLLVRATRQQMVLTVAGEMSETMVEDLVEAEMKSMGLDRWWQDRLKERS